MTRETVSGTETADLPGAFDLFCGVRIIFFLSRQADFFFQNLTLGYMIIFYFLHQNQNIFSSNIGIQNIFLEKKHTPPPEVKWSVPFSFCHYILCPSYVFSWPLRSSTCLFHNFRKLKPSQMYMVCISLKPQQNQDRVLRSCLLILVSIHLNSGLKYQRI